ncbi:MAG: cysteine desulfurase family protein [Gammaproteobacteria bacterium]|nr:cysteine desulfurase family protein [Gammaproteobacteria bacterium]
MSADIYLDYNGSAPLDPRVLDAMSPTLRDGIGNASSVHRFGRAQAARVETAREQVSQLVRATATSTVIFTSGATEANNLALQGIVADANPERTRIVISAVEHASVAAAASWLAQQGLAKVDTIPVTRGGAVDLAALEGLLDSDVLLVSAVAANSETGITNDLPAIGELAANAGAMFHSDVTQLVGRLPFDMAAVGADAVSISGHKICGPTGIGALVTNKTTARRLRPVLHGGGHERGLRSGSLNVAGIVGLGAASAIAADEQSSEAARVGQLRDALVAQLRNRLDGVIQNGDVRCRLPNTANLRFVGADGDAVMANMESVAVSSGSACSAGALEPSPVLLAMGMNRVAAEESLRFSLGRFTTADEVDEAARRAIRAVERVRFLTEGT